MSAAICGETISRMSLRSSGLRHSLFQLLVGVAAPQAFLLHPAVKALAGDAAPVAVAALHGAEHAHLQLGDDRAGGVRPVVEQEQSVLVLALRRDGGGAAAGQERVVDPAFGSLPVADPAP